jgi:hypothetical protein
MNFWVFRCGKMNERTDMTKFIADFGICLRNTPKNARRITESSWPSECGAVSEVRDKKVPRREVLAKITP